METTLDRREASTRRVCMRVAVELGLDDYEERFEADAVNLGMGGLSIRSSCLPDVGARLRCRFDTTPGGTQIVTDAEVVWARLDTERGGEFGLRFIEMDDCSRGLIEEMLAERAAYSVAGVDAPSDADATLELGAAGTAIHTRVARRGRRSARFEQRLDLLSLGRSLLAREHGHRSRQGSISGISLHLDEGTPVLSVNVDFEGELSFGEFEWNQDELDAILDAPEPIEGAALQAAPRDSHDTIPDLETPGAFAESEMAASADHKMKRVTVTEFEASLPRLLEPVEDAGEPAPSVAGTIDVMGLVDARAYDELGPDLGADDVHDAAGGPDLCITSVGERCSPVAEAPVVHALSEQDWDDPIEPAQVPTLRITDVDDGSDLDAHHGAVTVARDALRLDEGAQRTDGLPRSRVAIKRPEPAAAPSPWLQHASKMVAVASRATERLRADFAPVALKWIGTAGSASAAFGQRQLSVAAQAARRSMPTKARRRTTAGPAQRPVTQKRRGLPRTAILSLLGAGVVALGVVALAPTEAAQVQTLHRTISAPAAAATPDAPVLSVPKAANVNPSVPTPASVPSASPYAVDVKDPSSAGVPTAPPATAKGPVFGNLAAEGRRFKLRMTAPIKTLRGVADAGGFTVHIPGALSLDRAGPIAASHRAVRRSMILNKGDHSELTIRFASGTTPDYLVRGKGSELEIIIGK